jgi:RNase adaptor protein for sRNA GlmZ degradation
MKLVIIYGPPASGKLTVARELEKLIGFKVFHNHVTNDIIARFVEFKLENEVFWKYVRKLRKLIYNMAISEDIDLITTYCYVPEDDKHLKPFIKRMKKRGVKMYFVNLDCGERELHKRLKNPSRKKYKKLKNRNVLRKIMEKHDFYTSIPYVNSYKINNDKLSAKKVAEMIVRHYKLRKIK